MRRGTGAGYGGRVLAGELHRARRRLLWKRILGRVILAIREIMRDEKWGERGASSAAQASKGRLAELKVGLSEVVIESAILGIGRHAEIDQLLGTLLGRVERHRVFGRLHEGAHTGADRPGVEEIDAEVGAHSLIGPGPRQRLQRRLG